MSHSGVRVAYFACPHDQGWSEGDDENPAAWEFTVVHYQKLLKIGVAWAKRYTGASSGGGDDLDLDGEDSDGGENKENNGGGITCDRAESTTTDRLVARLVEAGGTYRTVAAVWYVW